MAFDYDLFVIGAGSGGVRASRMASQLGARVAVAEDRYLGGTCVNVGCVPKKLYVYASEFSKAFKESKNFGWHTEPAHFEWSVLRDNKTREISRLNDIYRNVLQNAGVILIEGRAEIVDAHSVKVGESIYTARYILVAVGGWPKRPEIEGGEYAIDSNQAFDLENFPKRALVQGGGYVAVEFAGIFNGLGAQTELVYRGPLFLRGFDNEIREFVAEEISRSGVDLSFNTDLQRIEKQNDGSMLVTLLNGETREVDLVFSAIGRVPLTENLGLENTAVERDLNGAIKVDDNFRTAEPSIYAIGDVINRVALTPVALAEGMSLARHLFGDQEVAMQYDNIATAVFCQPNIATLGFSEDQLIAKGVAHKVFTSIFRPLKNTISDSEQRNLMKLLVSTEDDKVIGAHMVGPDAAEIMQGVAIAIKAGATKKVFDETIGIHPSSAEEFVTMRVHQREFVPA